jgi:hypothetical protein
MSPFLNPLTLEDGTDTLSRNIDTQLPPYAASHSEQQDPTYILAEAWILASATNRLSLIKSRCRTVTVVGIGAN